MSAYLGRRAGGMASLALCLLLGGCGLRFQGQGSLPPALKQVHVAYKAPYSVVPAALVDDVKAVLRRNGATLTDTPKQAQVVITLTPPAESRRLLSVGGNGIAASYTLIESESYEVYFKSSGKTLKQSLSATQDYSYSGNVALAKQEEAERLRKAMQQDLAERLFFRLQAASQSSGAATAGEQSHKAHKAR